MRYHSQTDFREHSSDSVDVSKVVHVYSLLILGNGYYPSPSTISSPMAMAFFSMRGERVVWPSKQTQ